MHSGEWVVKVNKIYKQMVRMHKSEWNMVVSRIHMQKG